MKVDTDKIEWLLSHATAYQISKLSGVAQPTITNVINGKRQLKNLTIETGYKLTQTAKYAQSKILEANKQLIEDVLETIELFGEDFEVYAIKAHDDFISDFVDAKEPTKEEFPDATEFKKVMLDYKKNLSSLINSDYEKMTAGDLLGVLEKQRYIFVAD